MSGDLESQKDALRKQIRAELKKATAAECARASQQICDRLVQQPIWQKAKTVLFYAPMTGEPDIWPLLIAAIQQGKTAALPSFNTASAAYEVRHIKDAERDVVSGQYGIREPHSFHPLVPLNGLDLVLVPGIGYDVHGRRLGRGKGYYDRLLSVAGGLKCGVAFDTQIVPQIPTGPHDIQLNCILTPTRWIET